MQLSLDDASLLFDPRFQTGYWRVFQTESQSKRNDVQCDRYFVSFSSGMRRIVQRKFHTAVAGAAWIAGYFREVHGEDWMTWIFPNRYGLIRGSGWQIRQVGDGQFVLDVCPCGIWCWVEYRKDKRRTVIFPSKKKALLGLKRLAKHAWPLYGNRILDPSPYEAPRQCVFLPAKME